MWEQGEGSVEGRWNVGEEGECGRMDDGARGGFINKDRNNGLDMKGGLE